MRFVGGLTPALRRLTGASGVRGLGGRSRRRAITECRRPGWRSGAAWRRDRRGAVAADAVALPGRDAGEAVVVADAAVGLQRGADIGDAAEHPLRAKGIVEPVEMHEAVEQRQDHSLGPDTWPDRLDRGV